MIVAAPPKRTEARTYDWQTSLALRYPTELVTPRGGPFSHTHPTRFYRIVFSPKSLILLRHVLCSCRICNLDVSPLSVNRHSPSFARRRKGKTPEPPRDRISTVTCWRPAICRHRAAHRRAWRCGVAKTFLLNCKKQRLCCHQSDSLRCRSSRKNGVLPASFQATAFDWS